MAFKSFKTYFDLYFPFNSLFEKEKAPELIAAGKKFNAYKLPLKKRLILNTLKVSPWICGILFGLVLLLPFALPLLGLSKVSMVPGIDRSIGWLADLVKTVSVAGLIGYGTNYIAIRMLFRPVVRRPIWGQGMIPAQRDQIINTLAQGMHKFILSQELIRKRIEESGLIKRVNDILMDGSVRMLQDQALRAEIKNYLYDNLNDYFQRQEVREHLFEIIDDQVERKAEKGLKKLVLNAYKRVNKEDYDALINEVISDIPASSLDVIERLEEQIDEAVDFLQKQKRVTELYMLRFTVDLLNRIDIPALLRNQMAHFDESRLERMVWEATNEQLLYIQYLGAFLGICGGLLIWREYMIWVYAVLLLILYGLDEFLFRLNRNKSKRIESHTSKHQG